MRAQIIGLAVVVAALVAGCNGSSLSGTPTDLGNRPNYAHSAPSTSYGASQPSYGASQPSYGASQPSSTVGSACRTVDGKADPRCTPGVTNPGVTQANIHTTICVPGWTATIRPPASYTNSLKTRQMREYGLTGGPASVEEDHFLPLEVGGNPTSEQNLWPQPRSGAHPASEKDHEENAMHAAVCSGQLTLAAAQAKIRVDWLVRAAG